MEFTEYEWRHESLIGIREVGKVDFSQVIERLSNLDGRKQVRFGFGPMVVIGDFNKVHQLNIRATSSDKIEVYEAGFSVRCRHKFLKSTYKLEKWMAKCERTGYIDHSGKRIFPCRE